MFLTRKTLPRRTFLRGMGTALALPLLDAMVPALSALATGQPRVFLFVAAMIGGMLLSRAAPGERALKPG